MATKQFVVGSLIRIKGTNCEGTIEMIESADVPVNNKTSRWSSVNGAYAYVTLNKGMTYPTMRTFNVQTYGTWNLAKVPYEDLEERTAGAKGDVYDLIKTNNIAGLKLLKPTNLKKKGGNTEQKNCLNSLGFALVYGNLEVIKFMLTTGVPLPDNGIKEGYSKRNALEFLVNNKLLPVAEKLEVVDIIKTMDPTIEFGNTLNSCAYVQGIENTLPLLYRIYSKEKMIKAVGDKKDPWKNLLESSLACYAVENAKYLIREGFNMAEAVKHLKTMTVEYGDYRGLSMYEQVDGELKKGNARTFSGSKVISSMEELEKYAENPDLHIEIEKIKKETA